LALSNTAVIALAPLFGEISAEPTKVARTNLRRSFVVAIDVVDFGFCRFTSLSITD
jgi:hypothetical protein